ncbi:hypothetical protein WMF38_57455 [Sorangium sp. So ce118]
MKVSVDISDVPAVTRAAERTLGNVGDDMKKILDAAAREERRTHIYNNITHRLENSTFALGPFGSGDDVSVEYGARMEYASFVDDRGRTRVRELGDQAATEIEYRLESEADALGRM